MSTIKPLDKDAVVTLAKATKGIVTVEDHQVAGGLGSAISELLSVEYPVKMRMVGVKDRFGQSGQSKELLDYYGLDRESIIKAIRELHQ